MQNCNTVRPDSRIRSLYTYPAGDGTCNAYWYDSSSILWDWTQTYKDSDVELNTRNHDNDQWYFDWNHTQRQYNRVGEDKDAYGIEDFPNIHVRKGSRFESIVEDGSFEVCNPKLYVKSVYGNESHLPPKAQPFLVLKAGFKCPYQRLGVTCATGVFYPKQRDENISVYEGSDIEFYGIPYKKGSHSFHASQFEYDKYKVPTSWDDAAIIKYLVDQGFSETDGQTQDPGDKAHTGHMLFPVIRPYFLSWYKKYMEGFYFQAWLVLPGAGHDCVANFALKLSFIQHDKFGQGECELNQGCYMRAPESTDDIPGRQ